MKLRVLIADDEALARARLRQLLCEDPWIEIVGECQSGKDAVEKIRETTPDLVFLDIQMPEMDGFGVLEELKGQHLPVIVFVTAHDRFAVRAFDVHAVDYLLKPFDRSRFRTAFDRALQRLQTLVGPTLTAAAPADKGGSLERLAIKSQGRIALLSPEEIDWIESADNYAELHVAKTTHLLRATLKDLEKQLPQKDFVRISRSHLVNLGRVKEIRSKTHGDAVVILKDGTTLPASRIYLREVRRIISGFR